MPDSLNRPKSLAYCASPLRAETAALLHTASAGIAKMIAAALGVVRSRVDRQNAGEDANYLELVARLLDRIEREEGTERVKPILRWLAARYGFALATIQTKRATEEEIERCVAAAVTATSAAFAETIVATIDGIDDSERPNVSKALRVAIESLTDTLNRVEGPAPSAQGSRPRAVLSYGHQA